MPDWLILLLGPILGFILGALGLWAVSDVLCSLADREAMARAPFVSGVFFYVGAVLGAGTGIAVALVRTGHRAIAEGICFAFGLLVPTLLLLTAVIWHLRTRHLPIIEASPEYQPPPRLSLWREAAFGLALFGPFLSWILALLWAGVCLRA